MGHTPFGYRIENGIAVVDEPAADKTDSFIKIIWMGFPYPKQLPKLESKPTTAPPSV